MFKKKMMDAEEAAARANGNYGQPTPKTDRAFEAVCMFFFRILRWRFNRERAAAK